MTNLRKIPLFSFYSYPPCHKKGKKVMVHSRQNLTTVLPTLWQKILKKLFYLARQRLLSAVYFSLIHNRLEYHIYFNQDYEHKPIDRNKYFTIYYCTSISESFAPSRLNLKTVYTIPIILTKFIDHGKDKLDLMAQQDIVYKISYRDCNATYVDQTKKKLKTRVAEYRAKINKNRFILDHFQPSNHPRIQLE